MAHDRVAVTSGAAGASVTAYSRAFSGLLQAIYIEVGDLANTVDFTITEEETGAAILTLSNVSSSGWYSPRIPTHDAAGAGLLYAAAGAAVADRIPIDGRIKIVAAQPGNSHTGYVTPYVVLA